MRARHNWTSFSDVRVPAVKAALSSATVASSKLMVRGAAGASVAPRSAASSTSFVAFMADRIPLAGQSRIEVNWGLSMFKLFAISTLFAAAALAQGPAVGNWQYIDGPKTTFIR